MPIPVTNIGGNSFIVELEPPVRVTTLVKAIAAHTGFLCMRLKVLDGTRELRGSDMIDGTATLTYVVTETVNHHMAGGFWHSASIDTDGKVRCWGENIYGECTDIPELIPNETFADIAAGPQHTVALTSSGRVLCWGQDEHGQCSGIPDFLPEGTFRAVAAGWMFSAALTSDSHVLTWGDDENPATYCPVPPLHPGETILSIASKATHIAALTSKGRVLCWGEDHVGQCSRVPTA